MTPLEEIQDAIRRVCSVYPEGRLAFYKPEEISFFVSKNRSNYSCSTFLSMNRILRRLAREKANSAIESDSPSTLHSKLRGAICWICQVAKMKYPWIMERRRLTEDMITAVAQAILDERETKLFSGLRSSLTIVTAERSVRFRFGLKSSMSDDILVADSEVKDLSAPSFYDNCAKLAEFAESSKPGDIFKAEFRPKEKEKLQQFAAEQLRECHSAAWTDTLLVVAHKKEELL